MYYIRACIQLNVLYYTRVGVSDEGLFTSVCRTFVGPTTVGAETENDVQDVVTLGAH